MAYKHFLSTTLFGARKQEVRTPRLFYENLDKVVHFDFDPCPIDPTFDGLKVDWGERNFVNPPFHFVKDWVVKGSEEAARGKYCVFLIPFRPHTRYFQECVFHYPNDQIEHQFIFIHGYMRFEGFGSTFPGACFILVLKKKGCSFDPLKDYKCINTDGTKCLL